MTWTNVANRQILKMEHVLDNPTVPQNAEMIHAAFGKNAKVDKIKKTVVTLKTGTVPVTLHTDTDPSCVASVSYDGSISEAQAIPGNIDFGKDFHDTQRIIVVILIFSSLVSPMCYMSRKLQYAGCHTCP